MYTFIIKSSEIESSKHVYLSVIPKVDDLLFFEENERKIDKIIWTDTRENIEGSGMNNSGIIYLESLTNFSDID